MTGIYIHIPFCKQTCHYCNFHFSTSLKYKNEMLACLKKELEIKRHDDEIKTIYFGGGTPSLLDVRDVEKLIHTIHQYYHVDQDIECTFEINPDDVTPEFLNGLKALGINRPSLGIQSFLSADLKYMNRAHDEHQALQALTIVDDLFENYTIDLIYGTPTMTREGWVKNLEIMSSFRVPHISCYQLTVEEKTPLAALIERQKLAGINDKLVLQQFEYLMEYCEQNQYEHYELSNFAKEGYQAIHNSSYWEDKKYIGIGPSAHSYDGEVRSWNIAHNAKYMKSLQEDIVPETKEILTKEDVYNEFVLIQLRKNTGIKKGDIKEKFSTYSDYFFSQIQTFIEEGKIIEQEEAYVLSHEGKLWADYISQALMVV